MRSLTTNTERKKKEIKFYNIFPPRDCSCGREKCCFAVCLGASLDLNFIHFSFVSTSLAVLSSEFSYPSDFLTIKTRLSETCVVREDKNLSFCSKIAFDIFFSREFLFLVKLKRNGKK